jgi:hypothetical protein
LRRRSWPRQSAENLRRTEVAIEALNQTPTLIALTGLGLSIIFRVVLSSTLDLDHWAISILITSIALGGFVAVLEGAWRCSASSHRPTASRPEQQTLRARAREQTCWLQRGFSTC